jgi:hypothetical protein
MPSITSANAVLTIAIPNLFNSPQQLIGFAADDVYTTDVQPASEVLMGVDGILSAGYVFAPVIQHYALQADSPSVLLFETWYTSEQGIADVYFANGEIVLPAINRKWTMQVGALRDYPPMPDAQRTLRPRRFTIVWQRIVPQPILVSAV